MGSHLSKKPDQETQSSSSNNLPLSRELNSYSASCRVDADLQAFDESLQARTNNQVVKVILDCKKDIWRNQDLFDLVEDYLDNSLDFCAARDSQLLILLALNQFEEERNDNDHGAYSKTLEELKNFRDAGDPFTDEFFQMFQSVYQQQMHMLDKLHSTKRKLGKKLKCFSSWRRVSAIIFAAVLICSVVAAATSIPLGSMGKWTDSLMKGYEKVLMGQKEMVNVGTFVTIKDLDSIRVLIDGLEILG
ncbi:hypothetical protein SASPL_104523 [Salvia splendens]|uniref:Uncharacterized protein n=1 Tax=Salvia splendens TaxID=180675 RepID=A0A8X8YMW6_SALSN|nr:hypothetical protein SASPL_104523 [Salvia splendens]